MMNAYGGWELSYNIVNDTGQFTQALQEFYNCFLFNVVFHFTRVRGPADDERLGRVGIIL